jgi:Type III restriction enzyme, res subunit
METRINEEQISVESQVEASLKGLKDFQLETVERVYTILTDQVSTQNRVLVADEVGLGKTLVAKGVIAKLSQHFYQLGKKSLNVVYICSNQSIANQNLKKLKIFSNDNIEKTTESRLTMLPIKNFRHENAEDFFLNFIPLTPNTSFYLTDGGGMANERVVVYLLLKRIVKLANYQEKLSELLRLDVKEHNWKRSYINPEGQDCAATRFNNKLNEEIVQAFNEVLENSELLEKLIGICKSNVSIDSRRIRNIVGQLRQLIVEVSIQCLHPDLVIMDEFQRFKTLISHHELDNDVKIIADKFFSRKDLRTILLSATPYKLYSTSKELQEGENHYKEFEEVIRFLLNNETSFNEFLNKWHLYTDALVKKDGILSDEKLMKKREVENDLRGIMCRTERVTVSKDGNAMIDTSKVKTVDVDKGDIHYFIAADDITSTLKELTKRSYSPMEYYKSVPFMFSFMEKYKLKKDMQKSILSSPALKNVVKKYPEVWLSKNTISTYKHIQYPNAMLRELEREVFSQNGENLLWVPPSYPYYELRGPFKDSKGFSKHLIFSHWEMVPRMMSTLLSYEAERRTVGKLTKKKKDKKNLYFAQGEQRIPRSRLNFQKTKTKKKKRPSSMSNMVLLYPCFTFAQMILPQELLNETRSLEELQRAIKENIIPYLKKIKTWESDDVVDNGWYWAAPVLMDLLHNQERVIASFKQTEVLNELETTKSTGDSAFAEHLLYLEEGSINPEHFQLGKMPDDLLDILTLQVLGSPAVTALRTLSHFYGSDGEDLVHVMFDKALLISDEFRHKLNLPESISIIDLSYRTKDDYWKKVLNYCTDGNLQAVLDEYAYMIIENNNLTALTFENLIELGETLRDTLNLRAASFKVDTYNAFLHQNDQEQFNMRTHYSVSFSNQRVDEKSQGRTDDMRVAFNSPFRPFVLNTTSIGQEGLDFHWYCRKIVHWNLPSNPVELEQREGRINRYKGLMIRQNVANKYGQTSVNSEKTIWNQLFAASYLQEKGEHCDIKPFWLMEDSGESAVKLERIIYQYPYSKDVSALDRLLKILSLYRISLGQARQEEFLHFLMENYSEEEYQSLQELLMNLSPFYYKE